MSILLLTLAAPARAQLDQTGRWTQPSDAGADWQHKQIHLALLPGDGMSHSKILSWEGGAPFLGKLWGWNPGGSDCGSYPSAEFQEITVPTAIPNIFCSGHSTLATGDVVISGGTEANAVGLRQSLIFRRNPPTEQQRWETQGAMAAGRYYPTNTTLPSGKVMTFAGQRFWHMVGFGGTTSPQDPVSPTRKDIVRLGLTTSGEWQAPITGPANPGDAWPVPREGHSAVVYPNPANPYRPEVFIFGGRTDGGLLLQDAWTLKLDVISDKYEYNWAQIIPPDPPPARRTRHSAVMLADGSMIVYGGLDAGSQARSDVWKLSKDAQGFWHWTELITTGTTPGLRYGHTAVLDAARKRMLVFGGATTAGGTLADNEVYALSFDDLTWSQVLVASAKPAARDGHTLVFDPVQRVGPSGGYQSRAVLFGGRTSAGLKNDIWSLWIDAAGQLEWQEKTPLPPAGPLARARHAALWDGIGGFGRSLDRMVVFGGDLGAAPSDTAWALKPDLSAWTALGTQAPARAGHSAVWHPLNLDATDPELFDPATGSWQSQNAPKLQPTYPFMFVLPSGNLFYAGPKDTTFLFKATLPQPVWQPLPAAPSPFAGASAVAFRPGEIMKCAQYGDAVNRNTVKIVIDPSDASAGWVESANDMLPRTYQNLTVLPSGKVLVTGGLAGSDYRSSATDSVPEPEIWDPGGGAQGQGSWSGLGTLAVEPVRRAYHSSAILLPDARVLSAGGEQPVESLTPRHSKIATIFCPPYLFSGNGLAPRPSIQGVADTIAYGSQFWICSPDAGSITGTNARVCLIKPGAVTHAFNQDQLYAPLAYSLVSYKDSQGNTVQNLRATAPANANLAPPGYYLLFIVNSSGVPAVAKWVKVGTAPAFDDCDPVRPRRITNLSVCVTPELEEATLRWTAPADDSSFANSGSAKAYDIRWSSSPINNETDWNGAEAVYPSPPTPGSPDTTQSHTVTGVVYGQPRYFAMKTRDDQSASGNWALRSNPVSVYVGPTQDCGSGFAGGGGGGGGSSLVREPELASAQGAEGVTDAAAADGFIENSLFEGAAPGERVRDVLRLPGLSPDGGVYRTWVRTSGGERGAVDRARLLVVDHSGAGRALVLGAEVVLGTLTAPTQVLSDAGADVTAQVNGSGAEPYLGTPDHSVTAELGADGAAGPLVLAAARAGATGSPEASGILVQVPDGSGWQTVAQLYPRRDFDELVADVGGSTRVRLVFLSEVALRLVGRLAAATESPTLAWAPLQGAQETRAGDVMDAVAGTDSLTAGLAGPDTLQLSFAAPPAAKGLVRECFLWVEGTVQGGRETSAARLEPAKTDPNLPTDFALYPARPNPFTQRVAFRFALPVGVTAKLEVFDLQGRRVRSLLDGTLAPGYHVIEWDGRDASGAPAAAGSYFCRLTAGSFQARRKLTLAR